MFTSKYERMIPGYYRSRI